MQKEPLHLSKCCVSEADPLCLASRSAPDRQLLRWLWGTATTVSIKHEKAMLQLPGLIQLPREMRGGGCLPPSWVRV